MMFVVEVVGVAEVVTPPAGRTAGNPPVPISARCPMLRAGHAMSAIIREGALVWHQACLPS
jgi:hypothetical protein